MRRILDLSGSASLGEGPTVFRIRVAQGCLLISHGTEESPEEVRAPGPEVEVLILGPRLALTGAVLSTVLAHGGTILSVDERFRPAGMLLPLSAHHAHAERLRDQIASAPARRDALWAGITTAKIQAQAACLDRHDREKGSELRALAARVAPGDPHNLEAQAARLYWPALLGSDFARRDDAHPANLQLNYGYAVLRALVARAICTAGLHPALGLHHAGRLNAFALADDLMEPARPLVDAAVAVHPTAPLSRDTKRRLLSTLLTDVPFEGQQARLSEAYVQIARTLATTLRQDAGDLPWFAP